MQSKAGNTMIEMVLGIILIVVGLAMAGPLNTTITAMTTGNNGTAQGAAAVAMWGMVPLIFGVLLALIPLASVFKSLRSG